MTANATTAEARLAKLGIGLPTVPMPLGAYVSAVQTGNLLFLSGMLASSEHGGTTVGVLGKHLDVSAGRGAAYTAALNSLALARKQLGTLDRMSQDVRLVRVPFWVCYCFAPTAPSSHWIICVPLSLAIRHLHRSIPRFLGHPLVIGIDIYSGTEHWPISKMDKGRHVEINERPGAQCAAQDSWAHSK